MKKLFNRPDRRRQAARAGDISAIWAGWTPSSTPTTSSNHALRHMTEKVKRARPERHSHPGKQGIWPTAMPASAEEPRMKRALILGALALTAAVSLSACNLVRKTDEKAQQGVPAGGPPPFRRIKCAPGCGQGSPRSGVGRCDVVLASLRRLPSDVRHGNQPHYRASGCREAEACPADSPTAPT